MVRVARVHGCTPVTHNLYHRGIFISLKLIILDMLQKDMEWSRLYWVHDENPASENVSSHVSLVLKKKDSQSLFVILFVLGSKPRLLQIATANHFHQILQVTFCIDWIIIHFLIRYLIALFLFLHGLLSLPKFF